MIVRLINPRGRVVDINDEEENIDNLIRRGFTLAPSGAEANKSYNPVYDGGDDNLLKQADTRPIVSQSIGDVLKVTEV